MSTDIVQTDLRDLIAHREWVDSRHNLEDAFQRFGKSTCEFMAVLDGDRLLGVCCRRDA